MLMRFKADIQHPVVVGNGHMDHHQIQPYPLSE